VTYEYMASVSVSVCVPTTKHGNIVLEQKLREIFFVKKEGAARG